MELHSIFGNTFEAALHIIDTKDIIIYRPETELSTGGNSSNTSSGSGRPSNGYREICEITSKNYNAVTYKLFPNINYCQCTEFQFQVLSNSTGSGETKRQYTCKHCLALKLALILEKCQIQTITKDQFNFLIKQII